MSNTNQENKKPVANINKLVMNGRLTQNCNYRAPQIDTQGNVIKQSVAYFTVACNEGWLRNDGSEAVSYISCQISGKYADVMANHLLQGVGVVVEGRLRTWSDKTPTGQYENKYMVVADNVNLTSRPQAQTPMPPQQQNQGQNQGYQAPTQNYAPAPTAPAQQPAYTPAPSYAPAPAAPVPAAPVPQENPHQAPMPPTAPTQQPSYTPGSNPFFTPGQPVSAPAPAAPAAPAQQQFAYSNNPFEMGGVGSSANFA